MKLILSSVPYRGRSRSLQFNPDQNIVVFGDQELVNMRSQIKRYGRSLY